jgi:spermidine dehydrogenase
MDITPDHDPEGSSDDRLGMNEPITRRDFVNAALVAGGGLWLHGQMRALPTAGGATADTTASGTLADPWTGYGGVGDYARSNGNTFDVMNAAHAIRDRTFESKLAGAIDTGEMYDLLVVGGGISGLAAAVFFQ